MKAFTPHRPAAAYFTWLIAALILTAPLAAAPAAESSPANRTVGLFTYIGSGTTAAPARSFSGVLVDSSHIATSTFALAQAENQTSRYIDHASQIYIVYTTARGRQYTLQGRIPTLDPKSPITLITLEETERAALSKYILDATELAPMEVSADSRIVGVIAPEMLAVDRIGKQTVPAAIAMRFEAGGVTSLASGVLIPVTNPLPPSMLGGGVWNSQGQLLGILTRYDDALQIADTAAIKAALSPAVVVAPIVPVVKPPVTPPVTPIVKPPTSPGDPLSEEATAELLKTLKPLLDRMRFAKLSLTIDPSLLDYVNQDQADLVMERIGGGKFAEALSTLDTIEGLTSGSLAEQLNYRRALTLTLMGKFADGKAKAQRAAAASDPLVRARGRALAKVYEDHPDNTSGGKPISDSVTLGSLMRVAAASTADPGTGTGAVPVVPDPSPSNELKKSLEAAFQTAKNKQLDNRASFELIDQQLQSITKRITAAKAPELQTLATDVAAYRTQLLRREYERSGNELTTLQQKYQEEFAQLQYRTGPEWAVAGYLPDIHLAKANALVDNFNTALRHLQAVGQLMGGEKIDSAFKPLPPLSIAKSIDGR